MQHGGGHVAHYEKKQKILRSPHRQLSTVDKRRRLWHLCEKAAISEWTFCRKVRTMVVSGSDAHTRRARRAIFFAWRQIWRALRDIRCSVYTLAHRAQTASRRRCTRFTCSLWCVLPPAFAARARAASILRYASRPSGGSPDAPRADRCGAYCDRTRASARPLARKLHLLGVCSLFPRRARDPARTVLASVDQRSETARARRSPRAGSSTHEARWFPRAGLLAELAQGVFLLFAWHARALRGIRLLAPSCE